MKATYNSVKEFKLDRLEGIELLKPLASISLLRLCKNQYKLGS
jgi:hypothetical protein